MNYYNENDPFAARWLRNLIKEAVIPPGDVDTRDIRHVGSQDIKGYTQVHLFAGIGGWPHALSLAGWPEGRRILTGSCPCQPWSNANVADGGGKGHADDRHLWPDMFRLVRESDFPVVAGEQVVGAIGKGWLDGVFGDLESEGYACASAVLRGDSRGARHQRKRLYWVANAGSKRRAGHQPLNGVSLPAKTPLAVDGNALVRAGKALDGDFGDLLPCDGLSVVMERNAVKGYGNAIIPQVAAEFVSAFMEASS